MTNYPVGATQQKVLSALGLVATDFSEAEKLFSDLGIEVSGRRVGRTTEPVIRMKNTEIGGWNVGGDGSTGQLKFRNLNLSAIAQWIAK